MILLIVPGLITGAVWGLAWAACGRRRPQDLVDGFAWLLAVVVSISAWTTAAGIGLLSLIA